MTKVETLASEVDVVESRTRDIWELLMNMQPKSSPYSGVVSATPVESMLIRENDRQRERASRKSQNRNR